MSPLVVVVVLSAILRGHDLRVRDPFLPSFLQPPPHSAVISFSPTAKTALRGTPQTSSNAEGKTPEYIASQELVDLIRMELSG
ncbi:unnamed protein product [Vitrella brassicaformis CCMP3155]|uniref:Uncharacterized protein n=1 Tax=Vitrella brassicaformis (strain CCMP3155) TaxID=1169540 RepID=A0A0G4ECX2_VITBC|nr:unnamed protein product [Vitrella brassicaformis CCMP3155]|eukprot:CEL93182.1 unnamed protein product [Vitrella brassicaformis CCMP3155]